MPGFTPNFTFPYSLPADPADVPTAMKDLAESIDFNLGQLENLLKPRTMAQFRGTVPNTLSGTAIAGSLTWQLTDFNTVGSEFVPNGAQTAVQPIVDASTNAITVNHDGLWWIFGTAQAQSQVAAANIDELGVEILHNGGATPANSRSGTHNTVNAVDPTIVVDASCVIPLLAGDTVGLRGLVRRASGAATATFLSRSITLLRMTTS
ncbi:hypothetical protein [Streptomyces sp. NPDC002122]|uniref:hypothetical protein n=1 Tax=Streptomyces sp. NPDC002122 TaxID=3154407 RepID=UPI0033169FD8